MKNQTNYQQTISQIETSGFSQAESIEEKMRRITETREGIENIAPMIYTERKDGVLAEYDIRTDRFEIAQEAMGMISKSFVAKRAERIKEAEKKAEEAAASKEPKTEPTQTSE